MGVHRLRRLPLLILFALAACAGKKGTLAGPRPETVAVLVVSDAGAPGPQTALDDWLGSEEPENLLARETVRSLTKRGYRAHAVERTPGPAPSTEADAVSVARQTGMDAALVVRLGRLDLSSLRQLGRAEIDLEASLVGADGTLLWANAHQGATSVSTYQSRHDWRSHLRDALQRVLGELP